MPCYHPLKAFEIGKTDNGKKLLKVVSGLADHIEYHGSAWRAVVDSSKAPASVPAVYDSIPIPCGKCIGCRLEHSRQWALRCMLEYADADSAWFVTLTYDDDHVPVSLYGDADTAEPRPSYTLRKRDLQLFIKRLRKKYGDGIRYLASGEYGDASYRPHYHAIIFNLPLEDLELLSKSMRGYLYWRSRTLDTIWGRGYVTIGAVNFDTCSYVARYVTKKAGKDLSGLYDTLNIEPEFLVMSRRPGLGYKYYESHKDAIYAHDEVIYATPDGGRTAKPPRYFDQKFMLDSEDVMSYIKDKRKECALWTSQSVQHLTDLDEYEYNVVKENAVNGKLKSLKRGQV